MKKKMLSFLKAVFDNTLLLCKTGKINSKRCFYLVLKIYVGICQGVRKKKIINKWKMRRWEYFLLSFFPKKWSSTKKLEETIPSCSIVSHSRITSFSATSKKWVLSNTQFRRKKGVIKHSLTVYSQAEKKRRREKYRRQ
jgi:hypothetical protein